MTDPLSDMLTRLRNALRCHKATVELPYSRLKFAVAKILEHEGYIAGVEKGMQGKHPMIIVTLAYEGREPRIQTLRRISKPGHRAYTGVDTIPFVQGGAGIAILSTSNGLMTNREAHARRLGGEILCEVF
ncbi:30S ribosomal protein S8 [Candidatus Uhrbacteria bacterium]|nr:30S ribosomal protein S8 [Candidatus Uhrbacteria bacterium]